MGNGVSLEPEMRIPSGVVQNNFVHVPPKKSRRKSIDWINQKILWRNLHWKGKKKLFEKYKSTLIDSVDSVAFEFHGNKDTQPEELVEHITRNCEDDEALMARAIGVWIVSHVVYDDTAVNEIEDCSNPKIVLAQRRTICSGYCRLYEFLCGLIRIQCKYVSGLGRGSDYDPWNSFNIDSQTNEISDLHEPHEHAWNMVKLHGHWFMVDLTWAAGELHRSPKSETEFHSQWSEEWFICDPHTFLSTHYPFRNRKPYPKRQNLAHPLTDVFQWANTPLITPIFTAFGLKIESHNNLWVAASDENYFKLTFMKKSDFSIDYSTRLSKAGGKSIKNRIMINCQSHQICLRGFLHEPGDYKLEFWGSLVNAEESLMKKKLICVYGIRSESTEEFLPLPGPAKPYWGPTYNEKSVGIVALSHREPIIEMNSSTIHFTFATTKGVELGSNSSFRAVLFRGESSDEYDDPELEIEENACTWWTNGGKTHLRVMINSKDRYFRLSVSGKKVRSDDWAVAANYLIIRN